MRTMRTLTVLLLVSFLGKLSIAVEKEKIPECGTTYACFVPETCTTDDDTLAISAASTEEVKANNVVKKDCPAIIRFHAFTAKWMYVSIESLGAETSIRFKITSEDGDEVTFECENANSQVTGGYRSNGVLEGDLIESKDNPLKCAFIIKKDSKVNGIQGNIQFIIGGQASKPTLWDSNILHCDPSSVFKFKPLENSKKEEKYVAVEFSPSRPGKYECNENLFNRMQYKTEGSDSYKEATTMKCINRKFLALVGGQTIEIPSGDIHIRCAGEAHFFCKYEVNSVIPSGDATLKALEQSKSNSQTPLKGEIKCPSSHPFIIMNGKPMMKEGNPVMNGEFKCENQGSVSLWSVNDFILRENSAEVHCANKLKCDTVKKIPANAIRKGKLVGQIPTCRDGGIMREKLSWQEVMKIHCDDQTGKYMYKLKSGTEDIEVGDTKFECEFPRVIDEKKNNENKQQAIKTGGITTAGIILGAIIAATVGVCAVSWIRKRILMKRMIKKDRAEYLAANKKKLATEQNSGGKKKGGSQSASSEGNNYTDEPTPFHLSLRQLTVNLTTDGLMYIWKILPKVLCSLAEYAQEAVAPFKKGGGKEIYDKIDMKEAGVFSPSIENNKCFTEITSRMFPEEDKEDNKPKEEQKGE